MASGDKHLISGNETTNLADSTSNQVLVSTGENTSKFIDAADANLIGYNATSQTIDCDDMTTAGIYAITKSSTNLPDNINTAADYYILQVYTYSTTNGCQILRSVDYDSSTAIVCEWSRSWESGNFTDWFVHTKVDDANAITSGDVMVASDTYGNMQTGVAAKVSGSLTLGGSFGRYQSMSVYYNQSSYPSIGNRVYTTATSSEASCSISVAKIPLGSGTALVIITGRCTTWLTDNTEYFRFADGMFTDYLSCTISMYDLGTQGSSSNGKDYTIMPGGGSSSGTNCYLYMNRDDDLSSTTPFNFIAICYDSGYTTGSLT